MSRKNIAGNITKIIGGTPLVRLNRITDGKGSIVYAKIEGNNPGRSVKDRIALSMIEDAEGKGILKPDTILLEPTSGNTGIGLALVAAAKGYKLTLTMPETMSVERRDILSALGAELVLTPGPKGMKGAIERAEELKKENPNYLILQQFNNPANPKAHRETTGPEIWEATNGDIDIFVAGVGTGGTIIGVAEFMRTKGRKVQIVAVEPEESPVLSGGKPGPHKIQGIGAGFVPGIYKPELVDEVAQVNYEDAKATVLNLAKEGIFVGISSGAAVTAALRIANWPENSGKVVVTVLPDGGAKYLSTGLFAI